MEGVTSTEAKHLPQVIIVNDSLQQVRGQNVVYKTDYVGPHSFVNSVSKQAYIGLEDDISRAFLNEKAFIYWLAKKKQTIKTIAQEGDAVQGFLHAVPTVIPRVSDHSTNQH